MKYCQPLLIFDQYFILILVIFLSQVIVQDKIIDTNISVVYFFNFHTKSDGRMFFNNNIWGPIIPNPLTQINFSEENPIRGT